MSTIQLSNEEDIRMRENPVLGAAELERMKKEEEEWDRCRIEFDLGEQAQADEAEYLQDDGEAWEAVIDLADQERLQADAESCEAIFELEDPEDEEARLKADIEFGDAFGDEGDWQ